MKSPQTDLNQEEMIDAATAGVRRRITSIFSNHKDGRFSNEPWDIDVNGACGEKALAKILGIYWDGSNKTFKAPDVGPFQVRCTARTDGRLIIREGDKTDDQIYVFIIAELNKFTVKGWIKCKEAKIEEHRGKQDWNKDAWWINQRSLKPWKEFWDMFIDGQKQFYDRQTSTQRSGTNAPVPAAQPDLSHLPPTDRWPDTEMGDRACQTPMGDRSSSGHRRQHGSRPRFLS